jgi:predicted MPP superfamily phosphohydrolase
MKLRDWALLLGGAGGAMFTYGMLVEANRLVLERKTLRLPLWPSSKNGFKIAILSDFHLRGTWSVRLTRRAVRLALDEAPDMIVLPGDFVDYWRNESWDFLAEALQDLEEARGRTVAVPGNHDYFYERDAGRLDPILSNLGIRLLRNEIWTSQGVSWVGVDSAYRGHADPVGAIAPLAGETAICIWHEPDLVDRLPAGCALQISGHSHGGQFKLLPGFAPMHSKLGKKYPEGFYASTPTPLYVSRGIGTTGPPSRFLCAPEVSLLTLYSA